MEVLDGEGEGEEEEDMEANDMCVDPQSRFPVMSAPSVGQGSLAVAPAAKKKTSSTRGKKNERDDDDELLQTEVASERPAWMTKDPRISKVVEKIGMFALNPVENLENRKPMGHQLAGVGVLKHIKLARWLD